MAITDAAFICGLMKQNTDALGFIPRPTIEDRFVPAGHYLIQRNRFAKPVGYLIHGPVHPDGKLLIHQACIELDRRYRHFGHQTVQTLIDRAKRKGARVILLHCAADLDAVAFWTKLGFRQTRVSTGGARRRRTIIHFAYPLPGNQIERSAGAGFRLASCQSPPCFSQSPR